MELKTRLKALGRYFGTPAASCNESLMRADVTASRYEGISAAADRTSGGDASSESKIVGRLSNAVIGRVEDKEAERSEDKSEKTCWFRCGEGGSRSRRAHSSAKCYMG